MTTQRGSGKGIPAETEVRQDYDIQKLVVAPIGAQGKWWSSLRVRKGKKKIVQNPIKYHTAESELNSSGSLELLKNKLGSHMI